MTTVTKWNIVLPTRKSSLGLVEQLMTKIVATIDMDWEPYWSFDLEVTLEKTHAVRSAIYMVTGSPFSVQQNGEVPMNHVQ